MTFTVNGKTAQIVRDPDVAGDGNRGWQEDQVRCVIDGQTAGHLLIVYIPKQRFQSHYEDIISYMDKIHGWCLYERNENRRLRSNLPQLIQRIYHYMGKSNQRILSHHECLREWPKLIENIEKRYGKKYKKFQSFHVDKPMMDTICVYGKEEYNHHYVPGSYSREQQKRDVIDWHPWEDLIGIALLEEAARWVGEQKLVLYASNMELAENMTNIRRTRLYPRLWKMAREKGWNVGPSRKKGEKRYCLEMIDQKK